VFAKITSHFFDTYLSFIFDYLFDFIRVIIFWEISGELGD